MQVLHCRVLLFSSFSTRTNYAVAVFINLKTQNVCISEIKREQFAFVPLRLMKTAIYGFVGQANRLDNQLRPELFERLETVSFGL